MSANRRTFLAGGLASLCAAGIIRANMDNTAEDKITCLDYGLSFICNSAPFNAVRFWVESRTILYDDKAKTSTEFYQCASCKSENTFAEKDLFHKDNYDFLPILGEDHWLIYRRPVRLSERYRTVTPAEKIWGKPILKLRQGRGVTVLDTWEKIRDATAAGLPLISQTEIRNAETNLRAVIECPVKTMNVSLDKQKYQVDTGPLAYPDLSKRQERLIDCLSLAFVAFNAPDFADFIVEQPTPVIEEGREVCKIYHYSNPFSLPARNRLLALSVPE